MVEKAVEQKSGCWVCLAIEKIHSSGHFALVVLKGIIEQAVDGWCWMCISTGEVSEADYYIAREMGISFILPRVIMQTERFWG